MNFFRLWWGQLLSFLIFTGILWLIAYFVKKWVKTGAAEDDKTVKVWTNRTAFIMTAIAFIVFIVFVIQSAGVNMFPRSVIDRNDVNKQNQEANK